VLHCGHTCESGTQCISSRVQDIWHMQVANRGVVFVMQMTLMHGADNVNNYGKIA
jgi:hypothetical protein